MKEPSKSSQRNLWKSKTEEMRYARELRKLISDMGSELNTILTSCVTTDLLTGTQTLDLERFVTEMNKYITTSVEGRGKRITSSHAKVGMDMGLRYADSTLKKSQGITTQPTDYLKADVIYTQADWRVLDSLKIRNLSALKGITDDISKTIVRELSDGLNAGESIPKLSKRIQESASMGKTRATTMARTETINACSDAARQRYEQYGISEFKYIAATDERTCPTCGSYHGNIYKLTDNEHMPPIHPNCRCAIAPVIPKRH